ncbi:MAG: type II secretion system F family protein [Candidatus Omnitrophica bacterium]|nr:type II secretion system F family protein [Candidatus Omnitrophota bacterium]
MTATIPLLVFWTVFFGALAVKNYWLKGNDLPKERLHRFTVNEPLAHVELTVPAEKSKGADSLRRKLILAGLHRKSDLTAMTRFQRICRLLPVALVLFLFFMGFPKAQIFACGILFAVIFIIVPRLWILRLIFKRRRDIERHFPDTLDLLILCLEAGLSFDSSLVRVAKEQERVSSQISRELNLTNQETLAGKPREVALKNLADRTGVEDIKSIVSAVQQSMKLGTSLVKTLRTQADVMRKKRRERIRADIAKTPVKLIFPLLLFIFPTLLIVILGPSMVNVFRQLSLTGGAP